ncbi:MULTISPECIES: hypothetical protein [Nocardia]|uniref:hypothetical protein n=1 Tax=Nocardia TaxID=1817 RepID=UPI000FDBE341|nr:MULTISPECIES: hypothetical protein [Nocardia]MBF6311844.1 hypothetical protein [Nocardia farcinica]UEX20830.1 hypothetical protein LMJ57_17545 [Nocardia farcinica]
MRPRIFFSAIAIAATSMVSCSTSDDVRSGTTTMPTGTPLATSTSAVSVPTHGLLFAQYISNPNALVIEIVDPSTGQRSPVARFPGATLLGGLHQPGLDSELEFRMLVSPDLTRVLANRKINGDLHAGWLDRDGNFTDVTAGVQGSKNDFSGPVTGIGHGFDGQGRFHYSHRLGEETKILMLEPGEASGGRVVYTVGSTGLIPRPLFTADGELSFTSDDACAAVDAQTWVGRNYAYAEGAQVVRSTAAEPRPIGFCGEMLKLLPKTNTAKVFNPVTSPDGRRVAFMYRNADNSFSLYTVGVDGGTPEKLAAMPAQGVLVGWR